MNIKDFLFVVIMALITTWSIDYFFWGRKPFQLQEESASGQKFQAPQHKRELKPLNYEINFIDAKHTAQAELYTVKTDLANYTFSTDGGTLESLVFKRDQDGKHIELETITPHAQTEREQRCFLVGLNEHTPFFYSMHAPRELEDRVIVEYKADTHNVSIVKTFTIYKKIYRIDLALKVHPKKGAVEPRVIFPSPFIKAIEEQDKYAAIMTNEHGAVTVEKNLKKLEGAGWFEPSLLGTADKYFVHAMVKDEEDFAERGYFNQVGSEHITTFIEGPAVSEETTWHLSFYFGPKTEEAMRLVDPRLEKTLDYAGWLTPISQALLKLMKFLHNYLRNYGLVIIAVTALLKLVLLPFTIKGDKKAKEHAEFQRKMDYIKKKYKDDKETLQKEQAALIEKYGLPGLGGCLPMLIQLPIFFALNPILGSSLDLYKAPFLWIPDLSARDPYFILPVCIVLCMVTQALTLEKQGRMPAMAVALVIAAVSINFSAGLSLYIFTSALLGLLQAAIQKRVS
jgi:YidC/Oxa1 family membrane protein insertase